MSGGTLITVEVAAALLAVTPRRVRQLIEAGRLTAEKFGPSWAVDLGSVQARLAAAAKLKP